MPSSNLRSRIYSRNSSNLWKTGFLFSPNLRPDNVLEQPKSFETSSDPIRSFCTSMQKSVSSSVCVQHVSLPLRHLAVWCAHRCGGVFESVSTPKALCKSRRCPCPSRRSPCPSRRRRPCPSRSRRLCPSSGRRRPWHLRTKMQRVGPP